MRNTLLILVLLLAPAATMVACGDDGGGGGTGGGGGGGIGGGAGGGDGGSACDYVTDRGPAECWPCGADSEEHLLNSCPTTGCTPFDNERLPAATAPICASCGSSDPT